MTVAADEQRFRKLFGIERRRLGQGMVISPFLSCQQAARHMSRPRFFRGAAFRGVCGAIGGRPLSYIQSGMGHTMVADCVLAQEGRQVSTLVFVGAAGVWQGCALGDAVVISRAVFDAQYYRQFSICESGGECRMFIPDEQVVLLSERIARSHNVSLARTSIASVNSLWQQDEHLVPRLTRYGAAGVDLEAALFYAAASRREIPAVAMAVVTDIPGERPYWGAFSPKEYRLMARSLRRLLLVSLRIAAYSPA